MRVSIVTGGGRGIGRAIARALAGPDTFVIITGRTPNQLESAALDLESLGGRALPVAMDVTSHDSVRGALAGIRKAVAHVDVLARFARQDAVLIAGLKRNRRAVESLFPTDPWRALLKSMDGVIATSDDVVVKSQ